MGFVRSNVISNNPHKLEIGEQVNAVTSFLDLSVIYGSNYNRMKEVRSYNGGRLKMSPNNVLPMRNGVYFSGDDRVTQTTFLTTFYSLFARNHNHLADKLGAINKHWNDEKLFNEARKINIAIYQKIIYEEWLPLILGNETSEKLEEVQYDMEINPSTINEFSNGAFRILHAFIPSQYESRDQNMRVNLQNISDAIMEDEYSDCYENTIRGLLNQNMSTTGYSSEIMNKVFKNEDEIGLDLVSIDILRSRDHGIPAYHKFRKTCNIRPYNLYVFNDLEPQITKNAIVQLRQTYKTVYDIDLLIGGGLEQIDVKSSGVDYSPLVGPTFECIMLEQFRRWKAGDYYFYSHNISEYGFNEGMNIFLLFLILIYLR